MGAAQGQNKGYTVDFTLRLGNGATGGWDTTNNFSLNLGNGTLNINEAYIQWGSTILYSKDMSANADAIRIAYVAGDSANGLDAGLLHLAGGCSNRGSADGSGGKFFRPHVQLFRHAGRHPVPIWLWTGSPSAPSTTGITGPESLYLANGGRPPPLSNRA